MTEPIKPALTPEEWALRTPEHLNSGRLAWANPGTRMYPLDVFAFNSGHGQYSDSLSVVPERRHALAALALDGQGFGFTHGDVRAVRYAMSSLDAENDWLVGQLESIVTRIEALLPPDAKDKDT